MATQISPNHQDGVTDVVLIALNDNSHSYYAFDYYMGHFYKPGQKIIVAYVGEYKTLAFMSPRSTDPVMTKKIKDHEDDTMKRITNRVKARFDQAGIEGEFLALTGKAGEAIVKAGKKHKAMCIVTGSRDLSIIKSMLVGSVCQYVLHHAHCPVMVCGLKSNNV